MMKKFLSFHTLTPSICSLILILFTFSGALLSLYLGYRYTSQIIDNESYRKKNTVISQIVLTIDENTTFESITDTLLAHDLITNPLYFRLQAYLADFNAPFKCGDYILTSNLSTQDFFDILDHEMDDASDTLTFTMLPGTTIPELATQLEEAGIVRSEDFLEAVQNKTYDYAFLKAIPENTLYPLEGYLLPGCYTLRQNVTSEEIILTMLRQFDTMTRRYSTYLAHTHYSLHELLTIASLVECETTLDDERSRMAGVIYNRLNTHMCLQMRSSVAYILGKATDTLSPDHLKLDHPYNTHLYTGLPPGPICAPSEASFKAAFMSEAHDYYYYVTDSNDSRHHIFSHTLSEYRHAK